MNPHEIKTCIKHLKTPQIDLKTQYLNHDKDNNQLTNVLEDDSYRTVCF